VSLQGECSKKCTFSITNKLNPNSKPRTDSDNRADALFKGIVQNISKIKEKNITTTRK